MTRRHFLEVTLGGLVTATTFKKTMAQTISQGEAASGDLALWSHSSVRPVAPDQGRHSIHAYFNTCPESPDGRWVLYFTSDEAEAQRGDLRILERATGRETIIARDIETEDAHRTACQQWLAGGRFVVFHNFHSGQPDVVAIDVATFEERVLAKGRLVGWGQPRGDEVPLYGPHWDAKAFRDLEAVNVKTGKTRLLLTAAQVRAAYHDQISEEFGAHASIFFPILSPDEQRIFFKLATPAGGDFRSSQASLRRWMTCYDLKTSKFLFSRKKWGHPAWHPDSRHIITPPNELMDSNDGSLRTIPDLPGFPGSHPSISPNGKLWITDTQMQNFGKTAKDYGIVVAEMSGKNYVIIDSFDNSHGATSWRPPHPHPVFSADGQRIYFNVGSTRWTQLYVAERSQGT